MKDRRLLTTLYGAFVPAAIGAWCGVETPGLWGMVLYASTGVVAYKYWRDQKRSLWPLLVFIAALSPLTAPTRLLAVALRNLEGASFCLDRIALGLVAFWQVLGTAYVLSVLFRAEPDQQRRNE